MVAQVLAHTGEIDDRLDAERRELGLGSDAGEQQQLRRADRARRNDDLVRLEHGALSVGLDVHFRRAAVHDDDAAGARASPDHKVGTAPRQREVRDRGAHALAGADVERHGPAAVRVGVIVVGAGCVSGEEACLLVRDGRGRPARAGRSLDRDRAIPSMRGRGEIAVGLEALEVGDAGLVAPVRPGELGPRVEILAQRPQEHGRVDRGAPTDDAPAGDRDDRPEVGRARGVVPEIALVPRVDHGRESQLGRQRLGRWIVARLDEEDRTRGIFGEP